LAVFCLHLVLVTKVLLEMNRKLKKIFFFIFIIITAYFISSCKPLDVTSPEDKIGPMPKNEPNALEIAAASIKPAKKAVPTGPLQITITDALLMAMENNSSLQIQRFSPQIQRTFEREEMAVFDPDLLASVSQSRARTESVPRPGLGSRSATSRDFTGDVTLQQFFPTGTTLGLNGSTNLLNGSFLSQPFDSSRLGLTATQSLLR
jgi:hypothetical protein